MRRKWWSGTSRLKVELVITTVLISPAAKAVSAERKISSDAAFFIWSPFPTCRILAKIYLLSFRKLMKQFPVVVPHVTETSAGLAMTTLLITSGGDASRTAAARTFIDVPPFGGLVTVTT